MALLGDPGGHQRCISISTISSLRGGERYERIYPLEFDPSCSAGPSYDVLLPDGVHVAVDRVAGGFLVRRAGRQGLRALRPLPGRGRRSTCDAEQQEFAPTAKDGWEETELSEFIEDLVVDVAGLAREALVLALPARWCVPRSAGAVPHCGQDLNEGPCGCAPRRSTSAGAS